MYTTASHETLIRRRSADTFSQRAKAKGRIMFRPTLATLSPITLSQSALAVADRYAAAERFWTGCAAWDQWLPRGGIARGTLIELIQTEPASGAALLALRLAREAARMGGAIVVVDRRRTFYPP